MIKPFDVALKDLFEGRLEDLAPLSGYVIHGPVHVMDSDLATVVSAADKVLKVEDPEPWLLHFDFQAGFKVFLDERLHWYNA